jgi:D-alanine-D-alanine ligase
LRYPAIAKPSREDASLGIGANGVFKDRSELKAGIYNLHKVYGQPILIEEFIDGREFNLSLLQMGNRIEVLPISEICFDDLPPDAPRITSYDAKWLVDSPSFIGTPSVCPAELEEDTAEKLRGIARKVFSLLGGKDYGRVDFRLDASNRPFVLEYNPNPDISPESGFIRSLTASGRSYDDFLRSLLKNNGAENAEAVLS